MFAVVRTGGKQYRVAPGDKIVVEKLDGNAGDQITLGDVLLAGDGSDLKSTDGLTIAAEIVAQAKADKVTVFKKRRRHNYRRKKGHRQQHTILRIVSIGDQKEEKKAPAKAAKAPKPAEASPTPAPAAAPSGPAQVETQPTENPAPDNEKQANPPSDGNGNGKPAKTAKSKAKPTAETPSTENAAPAKAAAKKTPKAK
ncbi:large subunit ribosomal protein L21 [Sphingomonas sp. F9_3S_D5_B_2]